jgi:hypothetical protein
MTRRGQIVLRTVDELINSLTDQWDEDLIRLLFVSTDANLILKIPLSSRMTENFVAWHVSKNFVFSVRSAYHMEYEQQIGQKNRRGDGQGSSRVNPVWEVMWGLDVPSKVKIFHWKALHGVVLGMSIMADRHIKEHPQCLVCKKGPEDIKHLLFSCERASEVWRELGLLPEIKQYLKNELSSSVIM